MLKYTVKKVDERFVAQKRLDFPSFEGSSNTEINENTKNTKQWFPAGITKIWVLSWLGFQKTKNSSSDASFSMISWEEVM